MVEHSSVGRSGHFVFRGSDLWCQLGLLLNYWKEFPIWTNWTFNASMRNQKNSEMQRSRCPEAWYAKELNKLKKPCPFAKFVLTDAIKRSIVFPARTQELEQFYHDLTGLISEIPKHEINVIMGDWNVRLQKRLPHESHVVGPHVFRDEHSKIENLNDDQQRNRTEFIMFCQNHDYVVTNTWFGKPS